MRHLENGDQKGKTWILAALDMAFSVNEFLPQRTSLILKFSSMSAEIMIQKVCYKQFNE